MEPRSADLLCWSGDPVVHLCGWHLPQPQERDHVADGIELMLLAVNMNFIAFSRFLGDIDGQVFVFFVLTVAAAESAIGLAILVVLFRKRRRSTSKTWAPLKG